MYSDVVLDGSTKHNPRQELACLPSHIRPNVLAPINHGHLYIYSDYTEVYVPRVRVPKSHKKTAQRGVVTEFSKKSRTNMLREVSKIRNLENVLWCTLTYPGKYSMDDLGRPKDHLNALKRRLNRLFEGIGIIWRLELKTRKTGASEGQVVPHFHLMVANAGVPMYQFRDWLAWAWNMIVDPKDLKHRKTGTSVELLPDKAAVIGYISKYSAKVEDDEDHGEWGRRWGICGNFDRSYSIVLPISRTEFIELKKMVVGVLKARHVQTIRNAIEAGKKPKKIRALRKKRYYKKIKRGTPMKGLGVIGLGDNNNVRLWEILDTTIGRIVSVSLRIRYPVTQHLTWVT